jgi:hypothetical protein
MPGISADFQQAQNTSQVCILLLIPVLAQNLYDSPSGRQSFMVMMHTAGFWKGLAKRSRNMSSGGPRVAFAANTTTSPIPAR